MTIHLCPIKFSNAALLERVTEALLHRYSVVPLELGIELDSVFSKERGQYYSTQIIADAVEHANPLDGKLLILVEVDLFIPVFTFIFGEAQLRGPVALVSVCRLHEEFYTGRTNDNLLFERTMKEILHELGHTFGLVHCKSWDCVMHASASVEEIDIKGGGFCEECEKRTLH
ncbi:archaemetzincin family Zn-dependent metalloprotease [bacterium]|nr:archaemetzincin family Zn-dependent metalloprotease [bacterium]